MRNHYTASPVPSGLILGYEVGIVQPEETENLFLNPSFERDTTGWTYLGNGVRTATFQAVGCFALSLELIGSVGRVLSANTHNPDRYALSGYIRGQNLSKSDCLAYYDGASHPVDEIRYIGDGWIQISAVFTTTTNNTIGFEVLGGAGDFFYFDGLQLENKDFITTYCDGDHDPGENVFSVPTYRWTGVPHASTSTRSKFARNGGRVIWLRRDLNINVLSVSGLGLPSQQNTSLPFALVDGASYQRSRRSERAFSIAVQFSGEYLSMLQKSRSTLYQLMISDVTNTNQLFRVYLQNGNSAMVYTDVYYGGGLEQSHTNDFLENANIQLISPSPSLQSMVTRGANPDARVQFVLGGLNRPRVIERGADGSWTIIATFSDFAPGTEIRQIKYNPFDGNLYAVGDFTSPGTTFAVWDGSSWSDPFGSVTVSNSSRVMEFSPNGDVFVGGDLNITPGVLNQVVRYEISSGDVFAVGTQLTDGTSNDLVYGTDGKLYSCGSRGTSALTSNCFVFDFSTFAWTPVGAFTSDFIEHLAVVSSDLLYILSDNDLYTYDGSNFNLTEMDFATGQIIRAIDTSFFVARSIIGFSGVLRWDQFSTVTVGSSPSGNLRLGAYDARNNLLYVRNTDLAINGEEMYSSVATYNQIGWLPLDYEDASIDALAIANDGRLAIALGGSDSIHDLGNAFSLNNPGDLIAPISVRFNNNTNDVQRISQIRIVDTNQGVWFNQNMAPREICVLETSPIKLNYQSSISGSQLNTIRQGSQPLNLVLHPGNNRLSVFAVPVNALGNTLSVEVFFRPQYSSLDAAK